MQVSIHLTQRMTEKLYAGAIRLSMIRVAARSIIASDVPAISMALIGAACWCRP